MGITTIIQGIVVGISVSAPVGPVAVLCIQKTLNKGRNAGYISGFGAVSADTVYAVIAGFGLTFITNFLIGHEMFMRVGGGIVLVIMGIKMFFTNTVKQVREQRQGAKKNLLTDFATVFLLTISNPLTIITFGVVFAGLGFVVGETSFSSVLYLILGVFIGAIIWWFGLVTIINIFRHKFKLKRLYYINKISGVAIAAFGVLVAVSFFL